MFHNLRAGQIAGFLFPTRRFHVTARPPFDDKRLPGSRDKAVAERTSRRAHFDQCRYPSFQQCAGWLTSCRFSSRELRYVSPIQAHTNVASVRCAAYARRHGDTRPAIRYAARRIRQQLRIFAGFRFISARAGTTGHDQLLLKRASDVSLMMKGTPCSSGNHAPLKASSKTHYVTRSTNPAKRILPVPAATSGGLPGICAGGGGHGVLDCAKGVRQRAAALASIRKISVLATPSRPG